MIEIDPRYLTNQISKTKGNTQVLQVFYDLVSLLNVSVDEFFPCLRLIWIKAPEDDSWKNNLTAFTDKRFNYVESVADGIIKSKAKWRTSNPPLLKL